MPSWFSLPNNKHKEIIAIDIGTASVSAALARISEGALTEIVSIARHPFDLLRDEEYQGGQKRATRILGDSITKIFADMHGQRKTVHDIRVSVADPFFEEREATVVIDRQDANKPIERKEIDSALEKNNSEYTTREIISCFVNGYTVADAVGYRGSTLEILSRNFLISPAVKKQIEEQKEKFFPHCPMQYYSDTRLFQKTFNTSKQGPFPNLVLDIGGEVTSCFVLMDNAALAHCNPVYFGLRTLERRIESYLNIDHAHAESIVRQYSSGVLDEEMKARIDPLLGTMLSEWLAGVNDSIHARGVARGIQEINIAGAGRDLGIFNDYLSKHINILLGDDVTKPKINNFVVPTDTLFPQKSLTQGGDIVLASLILYG